jgi:hypothetical protein
VAVWIFWGLVMHTIFVAFKVEQQRRKQQRRNKTIPVAVFD